MFIDIGTPEDYARAQALFDSLSHAALFDPQAMPQAQQRP
jgi:NDP-sugar pyrophosphorylase family protein